MQTITVVDAPVNIAVVEQEVNGIVNSELIQLIDLSYETVTLTINETVVLIDRTTGLVTESSGSSNQTFFVQDTQPAATYNYGWIQTNYNNDPDAFTFWLYF